MSLKFISLLALVSSLFANAGEVSLIHKCSPRYTASAPVGTICSATTASGVVNWRVESGRTFRDLKTGILVTQVLRLDPKQSAEGSQTPASLCADKDMDLPSGYPE